MRATPAYLLCLIVAIALRTDTLLLTSVDWDESIYMLSADALLAGQAHYEAVWDNKPPGVHWIYLVAHLAPDPILGVRLLACAAVAAAAAIARSLFIRASGSAKLSWLPALLVMLGSRLHGGIAANTEIFSAPILAGVVLALLAHRPIVAGGLAAAAFWIKCNTAIDVAVVSAVFFAWQRCWRQIPRFLLGCIAVTLACLLPFLANPHPIWNAVIEANMRHTGDRHSLGATVWFALRMVDGQRVLWALAAIGTASMWRQPILILLLAWLAGATAAALAPGQPYEHYFVETTVPLAVLASTVLALATRGQPRLAMLATAITLIVAATPTTELRLPAQTWRSLRSAWQGEPVDGPSEIAQRILEHGHPSSLYVVDIEPVLYHLVGLLPPTKYAFPPFLIDTHFGHVAQIDQSAEIVRVLATRPEWIVRSTNPWHGYATRLADIDSHVAANYRQVAIVAGMELLRLGEK